MRTKLKDFQIDVVEIMSQLKDGKIIDAHRNLEDLEYRLGWAISTMLHEQDKKRGETNGK